jgi:hypothetical protein
MKLAKHILSTLIILAVSSAASAAEFEHDLAGHLKFQATYLHFDKENLYAVQNGQDQFSGVLDGRLKLKASRGNFRFETHGEILASGYDGDLQLEGLGLAFENLGGRQLPSDRRRLLRLTEDLIENPNFETVIRLDRLWLAWAQEQIVVRAGRQSLSFGNGLAFSVLDLFNPFSPVEIDRDYKPGDDMLYAQFVNGPHDLELLAVGRRSEHGSVQARESSFAGVYHLQIPKEEVDFELLLAKHYDEDIYGFGLAKTLFGSVFRFDLSFVDKKIGGNEINFLLNADRSWVLFEKNVYGFVEFFHNGFGQSDIKLSEVSSGLSERLQRGELYTLGTDYLAFGSQVEIQPLINVFSTFILNLHDPSAFAQLRVSWDYLENQNLLCGINLGLGSGGTEYGGLEISPGGPKLGPGASVYARVSRFF